MPPSIVTYTGTRCTSSGHSGTPATRSGRRRRMLELCTQCEVFQPREDFSVYRGVPKSRLRCDECRASRWKRCAGCLLVKPLEAFALARGRSTGHKSRCKECVGAAYNPEYQQDSNLRRLYGIGLADYRKMWEEQEGKCYTCQQECPSGRNLAVDHNHTTGEVRGLLCADCNRAIGLFKDDPARLRRAADYLERNAR